MGGSTIIILNNNRRRRESGYGLNLADLKRSSEEAEHRQRKETEQQELQAAAIRLNDEYERCEGYRLPEWVALQRAREALNFGSGNGSKSK